MALNQSEYLRVSWWMVVDSFFSGLGNLGMGGNSF